MFSCERRFCNHLKCIYFLKTHSQVCTTYCSKCMPLCINILISKIMPSKVIHTESAVSRRKSDDFTIHWYSNFTRMNETIIELYD